MMFHLITGGSGSGKSAYAEERILYYSGLEKVMAGIKRPCIYLAVMKPYGEESLRKIERHRRMRAGKGFITVERYTGLDRMVLPPNSGILLECLSNLTANEFYREDGSLNDGLETAKRILEGIRYLLEQTDNLVVVTNEVGSDVGNYSCKTKEYIALLGKLNQRLAGMADRVTEVVYGIPVPIKES